MERCVIRAVRGSRGTVGRSVGAWKVLACLRANPMFDWRV
jgi:hypothetical protein